MRVWEKAGSARWMRNEGPGTDRSYSPKVEANLEKWAAMKRGTQLSADPTEWKVN